MKYPDFTGAACVGIPTDIFYPVIDEPADMTTIRKICAACPVLIDCYQWALHHERHGIWAGSTPSERRTVRARLNISLVTPEAVFTAGVTL